MMKIWPIGAIMGMNRPLRRLDWIVSPYTGSACTSAENFYRRRKERKCKMHFVVIGTGGIGGYYGARLQANGQLVTFIARGTHLHALQTRGLRVNHPE